MMNTSKVFELDLLSPREFYYWIPLAQCIYLVLYVE